MRSDSSAIAPALVVSDLDRKRLTGLASAVLERHPDVADDLLGEMERAKVVSAEKVPATAVRMGSTVEFTSDGGPARRVTLVYPEDADIAAGRISILTPVGAALIGLSEGQTILSFRRDGSTQRLTVVSVTN
jgi:regulator of nucleoside diphosphate kinase